MITGTIGEVSVRLLGVTACLSLFVHGWAGLRGSLTSLRLSKAAMHVLLFLAAAASACLWTLLVREDWSYAYVADYTASGLPLIYRIAAFWAGNAGSLLFWCLILTLYGAVATWVEHEDSERMLPIVCLVMTTVVTFYALVLNFAADPFLRLPHPALAGAGLNPLLQNPGMTVHPVNVYLGDIGFTVPFAYAMAGLVLGKSDATWVRVTRRWTLISWLFLSIGILYGARWSYEELGWGGYWAWDPVENASLLPWLTATAFLHSAIVQERRGMLKRWNVVLLSLTFLLTLLGTFLTRSGVVWSIHAFANAPLGRWFLVFLGACTTAAAGLIVWRWPTLRPDRPFEAVVSKESSFLLNNLLLLGSAFAVLWGTVFPILSQALLGRPRMVSAPFYNAVNLPLAVCVLLLMGIGPRLAWRATTGRNAMAVIAAPLAVSVSVGSLVSALLWRRYHHWSWLGCAGMIAALFAVWTVWVEFYRAVRVRSALTGDTGLRSLIRLVAQNRRRYGGYIVHLAVAVIAIGIVGSSTYHVDAQVSMAPGQSLQIADYRLTYAGLGVRREDQGRALYANLIVQQGSRILGEMRPSALFYDDGEEPSTQVALYEQPMRDLYVVFTGTGQGGAVLLDIHVNPLVDWIWWGGDLFILGTLISLWPERRRHAREARDTDTEVPYTAPVYEELDELEYEYGTGKLEPVEYEHMRRALMQRIESQEAAWRAVREDLLAELGAVSSAAATVLEGGDRS